MLELIDYIADGVESFFKYMVREIAIAFIVITAPIWVLPYLIIRKYL